MTDPRQTNAAGQGPQEREPGHERALTVLRDNRARTALRGRRRCPSRRGRRRNLPGPLASPSAVLYSGNGQDIALERRGNRRQ
jgi:hypothetical protein